MSDGGLQDLADALGGEKTRIHNEEACVPREAYERVEAENDQFRRAYDAAVARIASLDQEVQHAQKWAEDVTERGAVRAAKMMELETRLREAEDYVNHFMKKAEQTEARLREAEENPSYFDYAGYEKMKARVASLEQNQCLICEYPSDHDQRLCVARVASLERLLETEQDVVKTLDAANKRLRVELGQTIVDHNTEVERLRVEYEKQSTDNDVLRYEVERLRAAGFAESKRANEAEALTASLEQENAGLKNILIDRGIATDA